MTAPFVTGLRSRKAVIDLSAGSANAITIRVEMPEVWDVVAMTVAPDVSVVAIKEAALQALLPDALQHQDFVVKLKGWEILDERETLAGAGAVNGSLLLLTYRRRRAVR